MLPCLSTDVHSKESTDYRKITSLSDSTPDIKVQEEKEKTRKLKICLSIPLFKPYVQRHKKIGQKL